MAQPNFAPISETSRLRSIDELEVPRRWSPYRTGELRFNKKPGQPRGKWLGSPGPDLGYALKLAEHLEHHIKLGKDESLHDAIDGIVVVAMKRSSYFGRAPMIGDIKFAINICGFSADLSGDKAKRRQELFASIGHSYDKKRRLASLINEDLLQLSPENAASAFNSDDRII